MMNLETYRMLFLAIALIGILLFASPTIGILIQPPSSEKFSELYMLGSNNTFETVPFNVNPEVAYSVNLGVVNHMGQSGYYNCLIKLRNETEPLPDILLGIPSSLPVLYEYNLFIKDGETWEQPLTFQINELNIVNGTSQISSISINGLEIPINKTSLWNSNKTGYYYNLFVELWMFNSTSGEFQFHERSVSLTLKMAQ